MTAPTEVVVVSLADGLLAFDARAVLAILRIPERDAETIVLSQALGRRDAEGASYGVVVRTELGARTVTVAGRAEIVPVARHGFMPLPERFASAAGGSYAALVRLERAEHTLALALDVTRLAAQMETLRR